MRPRVRKSRNHSNGRKGTDGISTLFTRGFGRLDIQLGYRGPLEIVVKSDFDHRRVALVARAVVSIRLELVVAIGIGGGVQIIIVRWMVPNELEGVVYKQASRGDWPSSLLASSLTEPCLAARRPISKFANVTTGGRIS